jgi:hypothetical protein
MTGTVLVVEERRERCGAGGGLQKESRGESRRWGRRAPLLAATETERKRKRSGGYDHTKGKKVTDRWASLQVIASDWPWA